MLLANTVSFVSTIRAWNRLFFRRHPLDWSTKFWPKELFIYCVRPNELSWLLKVLFSITDDTEPQQDAIPEVSVSKKVFPVTFIFDVPLKYKQPATFDSPLLQFEKVLLNIFPEIRFTKELSKAGTPGPAESTPL